MKSQTHAEVMREVFADPDRSLEKAVARAIRAGIALERCRIAAILTASEAKGRQQLAVWLALHENEMPVECAVGLLTETGSDSQFQDAPSSRSDSHVLH